MIIKAWMAFVAALLSTLFAALCFLLGLYLNHREVPMLVERINTTPITPPLVSVTLTLTAWELQAIVSSMGRNFGGKTYGLYQELSGITNRHGLETGSTFLQKEEIGVYGFHPSAT